MKREEWLALAERIEKAAWPDREIDVVGDFARVPLSKGRVSIIDAADVGLVAGRKWCALTSREKCYAVTNPPMKNGRRGGLIAMHRFIIGAPEGLEVDHINGDGLDNRRANLRLATTSQNQANRPVQRNNKLGVKGVIYAPHAKNRPYAAVIRVAGKQKWIGRFATVEEASDAFQKASREAFGDFAFALAMHAKESTPCPV